MTVLTASRYRVLSHISHKAFCYPGDEEALEALKRIPGVAQLFHWIIDNVLEEYVNIDNLYNSIRVNERQYPRIHGMVQECAQIIDVPMPEVYIHYSPVFNAYTYGVDRTFVTLHSSLIHGFSEAELMSVIGHELGHIKAGHVLYNSVALFIIQNLGILDKILPFNISALTLPMLIAMMEWRRRAEFTCDRAGLLTCQDPQASMNALAKFAGRLNKHEGDFSLDELVAQASEVQENGNKWLRMFVAYQNVGRSHPYSVLRVKQVDDWVKSGAYDKIMEGEFARDVTGEHELGSRVDCPGCKKSVNSKLRYCPHCGTGLKRPGPRGSECQQCGSPLASFADFCTVCGARVFGRSPGAASGASSNGNGHHADGTEKPGGGPDTTPPPSEDGGIGA